MFDFDYSVLTAPNDYGSTESEFYKKVYGELLKDEEQPKEKVTNKKETTMTNKTITASEIRPENITVLGKLTDFMILPKISKVIYNLKTTKTVPVFEADGRPVVDEKGKYKRETVQIEPTLATIVYFVDGSKTTVINCVKDKIEVLDKEVTYQDVDKTGKLITVKTGTFVKVASDESKELGLIYAIIKRLFGKVDTDPKSKNYNNTIPNGAARKLGNYIKYALDIGYADALNNEFKKALYKEHVARQEEAKQRKENRGNTLSENVSKIVEQTSELLELLKSDINKPLAN